MKDNSAFQTARIRMRLASIRAQLDELEEMISSERCPWRDGIVDAPPVCHLSKRESEILNLLLSGDRVKMIARDLFISPNTVRNHLKSIFRKFDVSSQTELIELFAHEKKRDAI